jgi:hypothetical protein
VSVATLPTAIDSLPESWGGQLARSDLDQLAELIRLQTKLLHDYLLWCESLHGVLGRQYASEPTCSQIETIRACQEDLEGRILHAEQELKLTSNLRGFLRRHRTDIALRDLLYAVAEETGAQLPSNRCSRRPSRRR